MSRQNERRRLIFPSSPGLSIPSAPYPLSYGPAALYYALRKINPNATAAIRVQRSSDNAQKDIGFIGRDLDVNTLLNFCAGSNGTVATWYDQSGNGTLYHATQSTLAAQPIIVNNGVLQTYSNGKPKLTFDGSRYLSTTTGFVLVNPLTHIVVCAPTSSNPNSPAGTIGGSTNAGNGHTLSYSGTVSQYKFNAGTSISPNVSGTANQPKVVCATADVADSQLDVNPNFTRGYANTNGIAGFEIGSAQTGQFRFYGGISEYAIFGSLSQNRKHLTARDMANHYGLSYGQLAYPVYDKAYVFAGDSLTFGQNATNLATNCYPAKYVSKKNTATPGNYFMMNTGYPGHKISDMSNRANLESGLKNYFYPSCPTILFVQIGTNDIIHADATAAQCYSALKVFLTSVIGTGKFSAVYVQTLPPTGYPNPGGGDYSQVVRDYNDLIRANASTELAALGVAGVSNLQSNAAFDDTPANVASVTTNATYYNVSDKTHLTDAGYDAVATIALATGS